MLTIGIIGGVGESYTESSSLYVEIVREANRRNIKKDQDHPPAIVLNLPILSEKHLLLSADILKGLGARIIVIPWELSNLTLEKLISSIKLPVFTMNNESKESLVCRVLDCSLSNKDDLINSDFEERITLNEEQKYFIEEIKKQHKINGIIGGAGPAASAQFSLELAKSGVPHLHLVDTTAPDKNNAILGVGSDFVPFYIRDIKLLENIVDSFSMPCNTVHAKLDILQKVTRKPFIDIRSGNILYLLRINDNNIRGKKVIILGTPATIKDGTYELLLKEQGSIPLIPDARQLEIIKKAIYNIKYGVNEPNPKESIIQVVDEIKNLHPGENVQTLLACTELPVPFTKEEFLRHSMVSTTLGLVFAVKASNIDQRKSYFLHRFNSFLNIKAFIDVIYSLLSIESYVPKNIASCGTAINIERAVNPSKTPDLIHNNNLELNH